MTIEKTSRQDINDEGGDVNNRNSQPPEQFFHSHMYESVDGAEFHGWDGILDPDAVAFAKELAKKREELEIADSPLLVPEDNIAMRAFLLAGLRQRRANRQPAELTGERLVVSSDGQFAEYQRPDGSTIRRFNIDLEDAG
jgi:hypothetical protein